MNDITLQPADSIAPESPFTFDSEQDTFRTLLDDYGAEITACETRRKLREHRVNIEELRKAGTLLPNETRIPDRTIEFNIKQEKGPYISYIEQSPTVLSMIDPADPTATFNSLEDWLTSLIRYENWQKPWDQMIDSMLLHGAGFLEVIFSDDTPQKFEVEYVRREHLIMPRATKDIQACLRVARCYEVTKHQLSIFLNKFAFEPRMVEKVIEFAKRRNEFTKIYKLYLRAPDNSVYIAWVADPVVGCDNWLKAPEPHFIGEYDTTDPLNPIPLPASVVPIFDFPYRTQEDEAILLVQGQAALSVHVQEALTGILSATVNTAYMASGLYASRESEPGSAPENKELYPLKPGYVHDGKLSFFSLPWPSPIALSIAQVLSVRNASQQGQTDFAAMSRNDTAKRATEIVAARDEAGKLQSTNLSLFSRRCFVLFKHIVTIIRNQVKIGLLKPPVDPVPLFNPAIIYAMSADTQVIKRENRKQQYITFWPLVQNSPLAGPYFQSMMKEIFPEEFDRWQQESLQSATQTDTHQQLMQRIGQTLFSLNPATLTPAQQAQISEILNELSGSPGGEAQPMAGGPNNGSPAQPSY